jgi:acetyl esterase/lipase
MKRSDIQPAARIELWGPGTLPAWDGEAQPAAHLTAWFRGESDRLRPAVIVCPGGGYSHLAEHEGAPVARFLARWGLAPVVLHYRTKPCMLDASLADARRAVRTLRHLGPEAGIDPDRVAMLGFSAGGHLAACISTLPATETPNDAIDRLEARPDLLVSCYAPVSLVAMGRGDRHAWLLGENPPPEMLRTIELDRHVTRHNPPTFLWHTADDTTVPVEQSILMARALRRMGIETALHVFNSGRHGLGLAQGAGQVAAWTSLLRDWMEEVGFLRAGREVGV